MMTRAYLIPDHNDLKHYTLFCIDDKCVSVMGFKNMSARGYQTPGKEVGYYNCPGMNCVVLRCTYSAWLSPWKMRGMAIDCRATFWMYWFTLSTG